MPSFSTALSGLDANSQDLAVISNNLANLNTTAYKGGSAAFQDLFYQQLGTSGSGEPIQVGVGVKVGSIPTDFTQGTIQSDGVPTDVALQGAGFLVGDLGGQQVFLRAGNLSVRSDGVLLGPDGSSILGNQAINGVINTNQTPGPLTISTGILSPPKATANVQLSTNLDSGTVVGGTFSTALTLIDSLGAAHVLTYAFTNTAPGAWTYSISIPAADITGAVAPVVLKAGTLAFNGSGQLTTPAANVTGIAIANLADGAANQTFNWNVYDQNKIGLLTQVASPSATASTLQDGFASGSLVSFSVGTDGTIQGKFSNGETQALGQILLATFANEGGLSRNGANEFQSTLASGAANIGIAGTGGRATISGGALEQSNIDISKQFANLIVAESGYQANAKVVTTLNTIVQATINLIQ